MRKCPHCGYGNDDDSPLCNLCSGKLPPKRQAYDGPSGQGYFEPRPIVAHVPDTKAQAPSFEVPHAKAEPAKDAEKDLDRERHFFVLPVGPPVRLETGSQAIMGRDESCPIRIVSQKVSRKHAEVRWDGTPPKAVLWDLGSQNGTFVNGERLAKQGKHILTDGDTIEMGGVSTTYRVLGPGVPNSTLDKGVGGSTVIAYRNKDETGLVGNAAILPVGEVLKRLGTLKASGHLEIFSSGVEGDFRLEDGKPVEGSFAGLPLAPAIAAVGALTQGTFRFEPRDDHARSPAAPGRHTPAPPPGKGAAPAKPAPRPPAPPAGGTGKIKAKPPAAPPAPGKAAPAQRQAPPPPRKPPEM